MNKQPNILLIMPDQMRGDCLSLENHPVLETPNMDRIGKNGVHFTRAYTTCPSCIAARRSLLTGQFPPSNRMVGYSEGLPIERPTLTQKLRISGYATAIAGRYMHQWPKEEPYGFEKRVLGSIYIRDDDYAKYLEKNAPELDGIRGIGLSNNGRDAKPFPLDEEMHASNWAVRQARNIIKEDNSEKPSFLVTSFYSPHSPLCPPPRFMEHFLGKQLPPTAIGDWEKEPPLETYVDNVDANRVKLEGEELRMTQAGYFGLIAQIDDLIEDLIADFKNKSKKEGRPWVIIFTSDHGDMLGDHYLFRKCEPYEGSSRIPLLIQGSPELGFKEGITCSSPVCLEDIMPTLLELADVEPPGNMDGKSLVSILKGEADTVREVLHGEHAICYDEEQGFHLLTDGKMKYIWRPASGTEQLFDIDSDPDELNDLSQNDAEELKRWRNLMIQELKNRPEGFTDGQNLIPGKEYGPVLPYSMKKDHYYCIVGRLCSNLIVDKLVIEEQDSFVLYENKPLPGKKYHDVGDSINKIDFDSVWNKFRIMSKNDVTDSNQGKMELGVGIVGGRLNLDINIFFEGELPNRVIRIEVEKREEIKFTSEEQEAIKKKELQLSLTCARDNAEVYLVPQLMNKLAISENIFDEHVFPKS